MKYTLKEMVTPENYVTNHDNEEIKRAPMHFQEQKGKYPDALLLYRMGDFYEAYCEDAQSIADCVGIAVTRGNYRIAGFPHHALDVYLPRLVRAGYRIAIFDGI